jgi:hypothetical protein
MTDHVMQGEFHNVNFILPDGLERIEINLFMADDGGQERPGRRPADAGIDVEGREIEAKINEALLKNFGHVVDDRPWDVADRMETAAAIVEEITGRAVGPGNLGAELIANELGRRMELARREGGKMDGKKVLEMLQPMREVLNDLESAALNDEQLSAKTLLDMAEKLTAAELAVIEENNRELTGELDRLEAERADLMDPARSAPKKNDRETLPESIQWALNSGDGVYRP